MSVGAVNKQTGERIPTAGMPAVDSVLSGTSTNPVQNRVVKAALDDKADTDMVAADFDATASYTAGNYCIYEGKFYKFKNNHSGAWSAADVDEIKIAGELASLRNGLTSKIECVTITIDDVEFPAGRSGDLYADLPSQYASRTIVSAYAYSLSKAIKPYVSYVDSENKRVQYYTENSESSALTRSVTVTFLIV